LFSFTISGKAKPIIVIKSFPRLEPVSYCHQSFLIAYFPGATADPGIQVNRRIIGYQFTKLGCIAFTVYDRLIQAFQLDRLWTFGIEIILFALSPLCLTTVSAVQPHRELVMLKPVVGLCSAGYPIHHGFGKRLVSVVTLHIGKGDDNIVE